MNIIPADLADPRVIDLLTAHFIAARAQTAAGSAHALDLAALQSADMLVWAAWEGEGTVGVGARRRLSAEHGEVK